MIKINDYKEFLLFEDLESKTNKYYKKLNDNSISKEEVKKLIKRHDELKAKMPAELKDLMSLEYDTLKQTIEDYENQSKKSQEERDYEFIKEIENYKVYKPITELGAIKLGRNAKWCISYDTSKTDERNQFNDYFINNKKDFYIFINKNDKTDKWALEIEDRDTAPEYYNYWDSNDDNINDFDFENKTGITTEDLDDNDIVYNHYYYTRKNPMIFNFRKIIFNTNNEWTEYKYYDAKNTELKSIEKFDDSNTTILDKEEYYKNGKLSQKRIRSADGLIDYNALFFENGKIKNFNNKKDKVKIVYFENNNIKGIQNNELTLKFYEDNKLETIIEGDENKKYLSFNENKKLSYYNEFKQGSLYLTFFFREDNELNSFENKNIKGFSSSYTYEKFNPVFGFKIKKDKIYGATFNIKTKELIEAYIEPKITNSNIYYYKDNKLDKIIADNEEKDKDIIYKNFPEEKMLFDIDFLINEINNSLNEVYAIKEKEKDYYNHYMQKKSEMQQKVELFIKRNLV